MAKARELDLATRAGKVRWAEDDDMEIRKGPDGLADVGDTFEDDGMGLQEILGEGSVRGPHAAECDAGEG